MKEKAWLFEVTALSFICFIAITTYSNTLHHDFLHWDDYSYVVENPRVHQLTRDNIVWMFTSYGVQNWHPLTWLSLAIDYKLWKGNPIGFHATNIALHLINIILIFFLTKEILRQHIHRGGHNHKIYISTSALAAPFLFAIHPQHTETIAWISDRKTLLSAIFFILTILSYTRNHSKAQNNKITPIISIFYMLAMMAKPISITLPLVLIACDIYPLNKIRINSWLIDLRQCVYEKSVLWLMAVGFACITILTQSLDGAIHSDQYPLVSRIINASYSFLYYAQQWLVPNGLSPYHPYPEAALSPSISSYAAIVFIIGLIAACFILFLRDTKWPLALLFYYASTLLPVIGLIQVGDQGAADRYSYISTIGFFVLSSFIILQVTKLPVLRLPSLALLFAIGLKYTTITISYNMIWSSDIPLWAYTLEKHPGTHIAHLNLGNAYYTRGNTALAINQYNASVSIKPDPAAYIGLCLAYLENNNTNLAIKALLSGLQEFPKATLLITKLADIYTNQKNYRQAELLYARAVAIDHDTADLYVRLAASQLAYGNTYSAIDTLKTALNINPDHLPAKKLLISINNTYSQDRK